MNTDILFNIINTSLQLIMVFFAGLALLSWKKEIRGREGYDFAKDLLKYIQELRFLVHESKRKCWHQIYINDILTNRDGFYTEQLLGIKNEKVLFDKSIMELFHHLSTRSDIFLPKQVRTLLVDLCPQSAKHVGTKKQFTYVELLGIKKPDILNLYDNKKEGTNVIYDIYVGKDLTFEEYFKKWEKLVLELQKYL